MKAEGRRQKAARGTAASAVPRYPAAFHRFCLPVICVLCAVLFPSSAFPQGRPSRQSQINQLFPLRGQAQSEALRNPPRRPPPTPRPDTVSLPYNLMWGDTTSRLAALFAGVEAKITNKKTEGDVETWTVQGLIAPNLIASLFKFQDGQLAALEFDYGQPDWDLAKYNEVMGQFRRLLEAKCEKPGEMVARQADQPTPEGLKQSFMGYKWSRGDTLVQLFYFSAEDPAKSMAYRSISVHYHYQDPHPLENVELPSNPNADPNVSPLFGGSAKPPPADAAPSQTPPPATEPTVTPPPQAPGPAGSPAAAPEPTPLDYETGISEVTPLETASPNPSPTKDGKKRGTKPRPTPEGDALPLPER